MAAQLEAEGYPWVGCECCKGTVWVPFQMLRERIPMLSAMTLDQLGARMRPKPPLGFRKLGQNQIVTIDQTSFDASGSCKRAFRINWWDTGNKKLGSEEREAM